MKGHYYIRPFYSKEQCREICSNLDRDVKLTPAADNPAAGVVKTAHVDLVGWNLAKAYLTDLEQCVYLTNQMFFGLDIYNLNDRICVNYNHYRSETQGEYDWHQDSIQNDIWDVKLTAIVNISEEEYEGGNFELFLKGGPKHIPEINIPGNILIFPSWIYHRVTPVTSGTRKTLSIWFTGPLLR